MNTTRTRSTNPRRVPKRFLIEAVLLAGLSLTVCLPWGCSGQHNTTAPASNNTFELPNGVIAHPGTFTNESASSSQVPIIYIADDPVEPILTVEADVGALGGVVTMQVTAKITADVTREAVGVDQRKTQFEFGPDGLEFRVPALLSIRSTEPEGALLDLEWWDPANELWVRTAEAVVVTGHATFPVSHFSNYRVTERVSLGGQQKTK